jgi:hypothetical protein
MPKVRTKTCPGCNQYEEIEVTSEEQKNLMSDMLIQKAVPRLTPGQRERFISGYCDPCWDKLFPPEEE